MSKGLIVLGIALILGSLAGGGVSAFVAFLECSGWYHSAPDCRAGLIGMGASMAGFVAGVVLLVRAARRRKTLPT